MKYGRFLPHVGFVILVVGFVLLNQAGLKFSLKQNKVVRVPLRTISQTLPARETAKVLRVIDGDTIEVSLDNKKETVRLIGIDAPEVLDEQKPIECFGKEASNKAKEILTGRTIILESDPTQEDKDDYRRLLRYVFLDGLNFNKLMLSEGYVHEYTHQNNPYKYMEEFKNAQKTAREEKIGLWADAAECTRTTF